ncbi:sugar ABC transporter ATP-binding protein [Rhodococcus sp. USK13]|uniref:sugar ABC transporter ATP-binding protein n=1 Tax=Rhodococcus sp. USK13 TaxID=2806442 RepID=UPI001BCDDEFE|nr:sugar ABC transporter ATP-binding protein [Rhodococcus sp. USK13]
MNAALIDKHQAGDSRPENLALVTRGLTKSFVGRKVLSEMDLEVQRGQVHAVLGQNGSGKSTLIKCLAGIHRPDAGEIVVGGRVLPRNYPPSAARRFGLAFVHQDLGLALDMSVADNVATVRGFERSGPFINTNAHHEAAKRVLDFIGVKAKPQTLVRDLPVTSRTLLAIGRAIDLTGAGDLQCLVLDEPTAALPDSDAHLLFDTVQQLTELGIGVVYVSHRLEEIDRLADTVTVLRDGSRMGTHKVKDITRKALVEEILGGGSQAVVAPSHTRARVEHLGPSEGMALEAENLSGVKIQNVSLAVRPREIVGIAGLAGSGRSELCRLLFGAQQARTGRRKIGGITVKRSSPAQSIDQGLVYIPEDRRGQACLMHMSVRENILLLQTPVRRGLIDRKRERRLAEEAVAQFQIRPDDSEALVASLSGGNQQKVLIAKWLRTNPSTIILDEPVQGMDVGAKAQVFAQLREAANAGTAVLVVDSDFDNLAELCDRTLVLRHGAIVAELAGAAMTNAAMTHATFGITEKADHIAADMEDGRSS